MKNVETEHSQTCLHYRSQTLKSDEAKWSKLTRITPVGSILGGNTHEFEKIRWGDGLVCLCSSYSYGLQRLLKGQKKVVS